MDVNRLITHTIKVTLNVPFQILDYVIPNISLLAGKKESFGFRHILARHTKRYFVDYNDKNNSTLFADDVTGRDIIRGIESFYENCVDVPAYNREPRNNAVYVGYSDINGTNIKCLLIIKTTTHQIVSFYPFKELAADNSRNQYFD